MSDSAVRPAPDEEWDDLMRQLRDQPNARPRPFFYTRVHARLAASAASKSPLLPGWLRRPADAVLLGALVMTLSGDGTTLRPAAEAIHCETCPNGQVLQR